MSHVTSESGPQAADARALDPFALPAETTVRFRLLVATAATLTVFMAGTALSWSRRLSGDDPDKLSAANERVFEPDAKPDLALLLSDSRHWVQLQVTRTVVELTWMSMGLCIVFAAAYALYRTHPRRERRRWKLRPLAAHADEKLVASVRDLLAEVKRMSPLATPSVEIEDGKMSEGRIDARVFGLKDSPVLALSPGVRLELYRAPERFRARIMHELAHVANGDAYREKLAWSLWLVTFVVVVAPVLLFLIVSVSTIPHADLKLFSAGVSIMIAQCLIKWGIVHYARASMVRVRELYADWRVAQWAPKLGALLAEHWRSSNEKPAHAFKRLWKYHPSSADRHAGLSNPIQLFRFRNDLAFVTGALLAYLFAGLAMIVPSLPLLPLQAAWLTTLPVLERFAQDPNEVSLLTKLFGMSILLLSFIVQIPIGIAVFLGPPYFITWIMGTQVQRQAMADLVMVRRRVYMKLLVPALLFAVGFEVALQSTPPTAGLYVPNSPAAAIAAAMAFLALVFVCWSWLSYIHFFAKKALGSHSSSVPPKRKRVGLNILGSFMLVALLTPILLCRIAIVVFGSRLGGPPQASLPMLSILAVLILLSCLGMASLVFIATWVTQKILRRANPIICTECGAASGLSHAVGSTCGHCNGRLAPWIFRRYPNASTSPS